MVFITPVYRVLECRNRERGDDLSGCLRSDTEAYREGLLQLSGCVSADIASIKACAVLEKLQTVLPRSRSRYLARLRARKNYARRAELTTCPHSRRILTGDKDFRGTIAIGGSASDPLDGTHISCAMA